MKEKIIVTNEPLNPRKCQAAKIYIPQSNSYMSAKVGKLALDGRKEINCQSIPEMENGKCCDTNQDEVG